MILYLIFSHSLMYYIYFLHTLLHIGPHFLLCLYLLLHYLYYLFLHLICDLSIRNDKTRKIVFEYHAGKKAKQKAQTPPPPPKQEEPPKDIDAASLRNRLDKITQTLAKGNWQSMAQAINIWSNGKYSAIEDVPDNEVPNILHMAESIYRKRGFTD